MGRRGGGGESGGDCGGGGGHYSIGLIGNIGDGYLLQFQKYWLLPATL
jgi:hypothetical protein